ncbi:putative chalcone--flavanone isomerase 3 [Cardamine amara subsp. amara]|uniref:Chalcone-flavonone isomerase family protein n=1 Tax=Cardamine amara subsp. amara TaxID=228776 RepID=A0ABD0ZQZ4_CARAN
MVMIHDVPFPPHILLTSKQLSLLGQGITDIEIHFLQVKFTAIGVYLDSSDIKIHLENWKGKTGKDLASDDDFFDALASAEMEKVIRVVVIKEIKGSQYGVQLENTVRDRLAAEDKYEEEEETELEKVVGFFQSKYFKANSIITYHFSPKDGICEIGFETEGKEEEKVLKVENANVVGMMQRWYLSASRGVSPSTIVSLADSLSAVLT